MLGETAENLAQRVVMLEQNCLDLVLGSHLTDDVEYLYIFKGLLEGLLEHLWRESDDSLELA